MITPQWCREMARYNHWQNSQLYDSVAALDEAALRKDRKAFFGSIFGTLNHLLWGDTLWMARFEGVAPPEVPLGASVALCPTLSVWRGDRQRMDMRISAWAQRLENLDVLGDMSYVSVARQHEVSVSKATAITHFFNHQTHHRGQVHAMLTAAGATAPVSDLVFMEPMA